MKQDPVLLGKGGASAKGWHKIASFLRCPKMYQLEQVRKLTVPAAQVPDHFAVGSLFHAGRARWFASRFKRDEKTWQKIADAVREAVEEYELPVSHQAEERALKLLHAYVDHYSMRPLPDPVAAEYLVGPAPVVAADSGHLRTARLDDVSRYPEAGGKLCIGESKTTSGSANECVNEYLLHGQPMLQLLLWRNCPNGEAKHGKAAGIMLDITCKPQGGKGRPKFARYFIDVPDSTLDWYGESLRDYLEVAEGIDWDSEVPRNITSCTYMAGRARVACPFRDLCRHGRSAAGQFVLPGGKSLLDPKNWKGKVAPWK